MRSALRVAEAFSPRTMAAAVAGDKPPRLSATKARVRKQITNERENTETSKDRERETRRLPRPPPIDESIIVASFSTASSHFDKAERSLSDVQFSA